ncbi:DNA-binding protein HEXBP [Spatholobus suberectus]|nr:DNA-binding protein HEXBP [Spatholobus suberectus]
MISNQVHVFRSPFPVLKYPCSKPPNTRLLFLLHANTNATLLPSPTILCSSLSDDSFSTPKPNQFGYNPPEELFGLEVELKPSKANSHTPEPRSWFGPNGQYIRELPCPSCRGRGYTPCTECGIERSRPDCPKCYGKGILTCHQCSGDCVIWEESIDEQPWERARSISPLKVKEDDEVDKLDIKLDVKKKSKRVYQSPPPEVGLKISRSLKSLNAKTGLFSNRMKIIHQDPELQAQRVAAIKKAKGTVAARKHTSKTMKAFFSDPINRQKRSMAMKGVKFYCQNCGREGHRRHYCPELKDSLIDRRFTCRVCGEKGHNRRTCRKLRISHSNGKMIKHHQCKVCCQFGHNRRTCPQAVPSKRRNTASRRAYKCRLCKKEGHNSRTCSSRTLVTEHPQD